jgi:methylmalonyl-CoA mutase N-terminal domain/subunit
MIAGGGGGGLTIEQPLNNVVRGAYYALASALSGTQTMALCSYDEAYTIPSPEAARLSLRTMQILMHETGVCDTVDPLAGSWFVETTTNQMEERILETMRGLDEQGGIVRAVSEGRVQAEVSRQAYEHERRLRAGTVKKVGVNCFVEQGEPEAEVEFHPYREAQAQAQVARLERVRRERYGERVRQTLAAVSRAAEKGENVMPSIMAAVEAYASVGEITQALVAVLGRYREPVRF